MIRRTRNSLFFVAACVIGVGVGVGLLIFFMAGSRTAPPQAFALINATNGLSADADWGTLKGTVVLDGEIPALKPIVVQGDSKAKDAAVCAAQDIPNEELVVDSATRGIANVVIYLKTKPSKIHPDLVKSKLEEVKFEQTGCRFVPHILSVRTDQVVRVISGDEVAHNFHPMLSRNRPSQIVEPYDPAGRLVKEVTLAERLPAKIVCDIHPWMRAYWVILDHPYAAVTDEQGHFEISNLPVGQHKFTIWHESAGYLDKRYVLNIKTGINSVNGMKFTSAQFLK